MIVDMKKIHLLVQSKDVASALKEVRNFSSIHIEHHKERVSDSSVDLRNDLVSLEKMRDGLKEFGTSILQIKSSGIVKEISLIVKKQDRLAELEQGILKWQKVIEEWEEWGDFNPQDIIDLRHKGVFVELCILTKKQIGEIPEGIIVEKLQLKEKKNLCLLLARKEIGIPFDKKVLPSGCLLKMKVSQKQYQEEMQSLTKELEESVQYSDEIEDRIYILRREITFQEATQGMDNQGVLKVLRGYCPVDKCSELKKKARDENWGLVLEDVNKEDNPPTLLRNAKWVNLSRPVLKIIEILPGFRELDVSAIFLIFFTLFFGMLIGDAAYGAIFLIGTMIAHRTMKVKDATGFYLMYLLTGFTILWGVLTGTYFGQEWISQSVRPVVPWLNNADNMQWLCFTVALTHLSLARLWVAKIKFPCITFLSEIGWLMVVWGMYFLAGMFVLSRPLPSFTTPLILGGALIAFVFMFPSIKDFRQGVGQKLIPHILSVIGSGTDIISYIRLFAVGLATVAVADAANAMPAALPGVGYGFMVFLHMLNLVLAAMAILVHAVRLNVLEFSGHLGLEWTGFRYNPFK